MTCQQREIYNVEDDPEEIFEQACLDGEGADDLEGEYIV
jgi:hypothetical protein